MAQKINDQSPFHFEWNEAKNDANIRKHGFDFFDAEEMFRGTLVVRADLRRDYGENRWLGIGTTQARTAVVVFTERGANSIRIISLRKATRREQKEYEKTIQDGLETGRCAAG
jgi:uncharacterized DUF497 family protein